MNFHLSIPILTIAATLLVVVTGLLNFSVFVRQLRASREQLELLVRLRSIDHADPLELAKYTVHP